MSETVSKEFSKLFAKSDLQNAKMVDYPSDEILQIAANVSMKVLHHDLNLE